LRVDFYHLTRAPVAAVLPVIAERLLDGGERLLVCVEDAGERAGIDKALWDYRPNSFLPHAQIGGEQDAAQPILLSSETDATNAARNIAIADGIWRDDALGYDRAFYFFTSENIDDARGAWRALATRDGVDRHYWKQDEAGKWREGP
jgi:DNA polymerase III subunit chi